MYRPRNVPPDAAALPQFLDQELRNISQALDAPVFILGLSVSHAEPGRLQEGMLVLADGADWNPGSGSGFYGYRAGAWRFLG